MSSSSSWETFPESPANAHPAAELGREPSALGLLEQRALADRNDPIAAQEPQRPVRGLARHRERGWGERLGQNRITSDLADSLDQLWWSAHRDRRVIQWAKRPLAHTPAALTGSDVLDAHSGMAGGEVGDLTLIEPVRRRARVVQKANLAIGPLVAQRAEH